MLSHLTRCRSKHPLSVRQHLSQQGLQRQDQRIVRVMSMLQLNGIELHRSIETELSENPALELADAVEIDGISGVGHGPSDREVIQLLDSLSRSSMGGYERGDEWIYDNADTAAYDPLRNVCTTVTLQQHLLTNLRSVADVEDIPLGEYLICSLDDRGYLTESLESIAQERSVPLETVDRVLKIVQSLDPSGVAARDLQECLLLQLDDLEIDIDAHNSTLVPLARMILNEHFQLLAHKCYPRLMRKLRIDREHLDEVMHFIRQNLNPFPAAKFRNQHPGLPGSENVATLIPDVVVKRTDTGYNVEVAMGSPRQFVVNRQWEKAYDALLKKRSGDIDSAQIAEFVDRARQFIASLDIRQKVLKRIVNNVLETQIGFVETGSVKYLRPLTRCTIAEKLNLHESTVSRSLAGKFVQLPSGEVVSFDIFFENARPIMAAIEEIIQAENGDKPLSDQRIVDILAAQGIVVARRTVNKYREKLKIGSSLLRRQ